MANFCANCGRGLAAGPQQAGGQILTAEARRVITTVFVDLVGSTGLTERLDPEDARAVIGRFYTAVQQTVERFGETVANLLGDGVLATFGLPATHEDDPERAVRAGLALQPALASLYTALAAHQLQLSVRVGINTGEVVAASGSPFDRDFLVSDAVTVAARIQQAAAPGAVVVGERTYRLTRGAIAYRELAPVEAKGKTAPLRVWEAIAPLEERQRTHGLLAPLVDGEVEFELLRGTYERSRRTPQVHLVTSLGQPGVGKTRLVHEFLAAVGAGDPAPLCLRGRSLALAGRIGYHALLDILRAQAGWHDTDPPETVRARLAHWLREAIGDADEVLDGLWLTFGSGNGHDDPGRTRQQLFDAWRQLLARLARRRPVIVVFEDMHWADEGLLDLVPSIVADVRNAALCLVCVARPELLERRPAWGAGGRNQLHIDLHPLTPDETERLIDALSPRPLRPEVRQALVRRAEGNPLFAEELVGMVAMEEEPWRPGADLAVPDTIQAVIAARIDRLPAEERRVLQAAAVIGHAFWPSATAQLAGVSPDEARRIIVALAAKDLVEEHARSAVGDEPEFAFRQTLTREVAYGMLPRAQRQRAHAEAARWLEARLGDRAEDSVEIVAEHFRLGGDDARAAVYLHRAAAKARRQYANADALRLYEQALAAAQIAGLQADLPALYLGRGEVHQLLGDYAAALADFQAGLRLAQAAGDRAREAAFENRVGFVHHREARLDEAEQHFQRAAALARASDDRRALALSLVDLATVAWDRGEMPFAQRTLGEAVTLLRETDDHATLARALNLRCMTHLALGQTDEAIAAATDALVIARAAGDRSREATSLSYLGVVHTWAGEPRRALEYNEAALALAETIGDRRRAVYAKEFLAQLYWDTGRGARRSASPMTCCRRRASSRPGSSRSSTSP
ncbi:MAG: tetratricopeptide repeat protein [Armatimonadota bacterium]|nr:tetratricopeptide repeat protein [Armatimonadota bacterium]